MGMGGWIKEIEKERGVQPLTSIESVGIELVNGIRYEPGDDEFDAEQRPDAGEPESGRTGKNFEQFIV